MKYAIIYSGGMDSQTLLWQKREKIGLAISFDYGSKHNHKEIEYAKKNCLMLGIEHIVISLNFINQYFTSDLLLNGGEIPEGHYEDESMKKTVVPFRNGIMLSIAVGIAESRGYKGVFIANHAGDHAIYPDCRGDFIEYIDKASQCGTYNEVKILSPYLLKTKKEIAQIGKKINVPYELSWSCYKGEESPCGLCGTCVERKEALE